MPRPARSPETALEAFAAAKAELDAMLADLQEISDNHFNLHPDDVAWSTVGVLNGYIGLLSLIASRAKRAFGPARP